MVPKPRPILEDNYAKRVRAAAGPAANLKVEKGPVITLEEAERFEAAMRRYISTPKGSDERLIAFAEALPILVKGYNAKATDPTLTDEEKRLIIHIGRHIQTIVKEVNEALSSPNRETRRLGFRVYAEAGAIKKIAALAKDHEFEDVSRDALAYILDQLRKCALKGGKPQTRAQLKGLLAEIGATATYASVRDAVVDYFAFGQEMPKTGKYVVDPTTGELVSQGRESFANADREHLLLIARKTPFRDTQRRVFGIIRAADNEAAEIDRIAEKEMPEFLKMLCPGYEQRKKKSEPEEPPPAGAMAVLPTAAEDAPPPKKTLFKRPPPTEPAYAAGAA